MTDAPAPDHGRRPRRLWPVFAASALTLATAGFAIGASTAGAVGANAARPLVLTDHAAKPVIVASARRGKLGVILETSKGFTLYHYALDTSKKSACTGGCAQAWPPLVLPKGVTKATAGTGVSQALLGTVKRGGGVLQVTYRGEPLYTFGGDTKAGETSGQGVGNFHVVTVKAAATPASTPSTSAGY